MTVSLAADANPAAFAALIPDEEFTPGTADAVARLPAFLTKIRAAEALTGLPFAETDAALQDALVLRRLGQMIETLRLNPHWAARIASAGIKGPLESFEQWQAIPIADKQTMRDFFMGSREGLVVPLSHGGFEIVASGGTSSGEPVEVVYSLRELHDTYRLAGEFMGRYQLARFLDGPEAQWMMTTLADYQMWSSGTMVGGVFQNIPRTNYVGAGPVTKDVFQHMMRYEGLKAFMGITASVALLPEMSEGLDEIARRSLRVAMYGSGALNPRVRTELKARYPEVAVLSYFAATQAETIGLQLDPDTPWLATVPGLHLVEVVDADGRWVAEGEEGELVVTRLHAHEAPFPRLSIGDRVIRRPGLSGPGLTTQQFEFAGRSNDVIHLGDTQFAATRVLPALVQGFRAMGIDLDQAHELQFVNDRPTRTLRLVAAVDEPALFNKRIDLLGYPALFHVFSQAMAASLSLFNQGEANVGYIVKSGYRFEARGIARGGTEIERTSVGKTPLLHDVHG
jgi:phenylacetate-CoA ligase